MKPFPPLSAMQLRIVHGVLKGMSTEEIAAAVCRHRSTVYEQIREIRRKLKLVEQTAHSNAELFAWARKVGLVKYHPLLVPPSLGTGATPASDALPSRQGPAAGLATGAG